MSSPYTSYGFQDLREYALNTYTHVALVDENGNEITRIDVTSDSRVQNTPSAASNPVEYVIEVKGGDSDIPIGSGAVTVSATRLYESAGASNAVGVDSMKDATLEAPNDTLTVSHQQELPQQ